MKRKKLRGGMAALVALLMGVPMAEEAVAGDIGNVADAGLSLAYAIIDIVGNS